MSPDRHAHRSATGDTDSSLKEYESPLSLAEVNPMTNAAYRAMVRGKKSEKSSDDVWKEVKETTAKQEWDIENMLDEELDSVPPQQATDD